MSLIAGLDYSTHAVDVVLLDEDSDAATWHRFELSGRDAFERTRSLRVLLSTRGRSTWDDVLACGIEQPRGHHGTVHLARIQGAILACLPRPLLVQPWNPAEWRKAVGLPGNASKDAVSHYVRTRRWYTFNRTPDGEDWPQDACDAYCIALATRNVLQRTEAA